MADRIVYLNGRFVPESQARLSIYDSGLTMGDMAFEVTRTFRGRPFRLRQHLERLFHSLRIIRTDPGLDIGELEALTERTLALNLPTQPAEIDWNILHNISRGPAAAFVEAFAADELRPSVIISCFPLVSKMAAVAHLYEQGLDLVIPPQHAIPRDLIDPTIKSRSRIHYHIANFQAADIQLGAWALLATPGGRLTEGTSGNFFMVRDRVLLTPRAEDVLIGVTRSVILELAARLGIESRECDIRLADCRPAEEMFLTSTSIGLLHARSFNGTRLGSGAIGPVTARLREALNHDVGLDFAAQAAEYAKRIAASTTLHPS